MRTVLGLDLGTNSIGWALVKEAEKPGEVSEIVKLGVRVNPLTTDEQLDFEEVDQYQRTRIEPLKEVPDAICNVLS